MGVLDRLRGLRDRLVSKTPETANLERPHQTVYGQLGKTWRADKLPPFSLWYAELMRYDPQVSFGLRVRNGFIAAAECEFVRGRDDVIEWVNNQWRRIWATSAPMLLRTKNVGHRAFEVMYREEDDGTLGFDRLHELHATMVRPIQRGKGGGETVGSLVRRAGSFLYTFARPSMTLALEKIPDTAEEVKLFAPKLLWATFDAEDGNPFGRPLLESAFSPWWEKWMEHGSKRTTQLRMIKDAYIGDIFWYPEGQKAKLPTGEEISWRDLAREMGENRLAGGTMALPNKYDNNGNKLFDYQPPQAMQGDTKVFEWGNENDIAIWKGLDIAPEIITAAATGSGFSGRSIPLVVTAAIMLCEYADLVYSVDQMILRPMAHLLFGVRPQYEVQLIELDDFIAKILGGTGSSVGGGGVGAGPGSPSPLLLPPQQFEDVDNVAPIADRLATLGQGKARQIAREARRRIINLAKKNGGPQQS